MLYDVTTFLFVIVCVVLLLVILLQQGSGDMSSAFGGSGSQAAFGARGGATLLTRLTAIFAVLFMLGAMALTVIGQRGAGSVVADTATLPVRSAAPTVPATPSAAPADAPDPAPVPTK